MAEENDYIEIDLVRLLSALWRHFWIILLSMVIFGAAGFGYANYLITPLYQSDVQMYVNNADISVGSTSIKFSQGDLLAAQGLVDTYIVILNSRPMLDDVIDELELPYSYEQLKGMIDAEAVNGTEVFQITVTDANRKEAKEIANKIAELLPEHISAVVDGSSVRVVQYAVLAGGPCSPNVVKYLCLGIALGFLLSAGIIVLRVLLDKRVHDPEDLAKRYDIPVIAVIPDLEKKGSSKYGQYYKERAVTRWRLRQKRKKKTQSRRRRPSLMEKPAKASISDRAWDLRAQRPISCCERI